MDALAGHPPREQLAAFVEGRLSGDAQDEIERHVAGCDACCTVIAGLPADTLLAPLKDANTGVVFSPAVGSGRCPAVGSGRRSAEPIPEQLADHPRYRVVRPLGTGGMGTVFLAEHRLMERQVALKVIRRDLLRHPVAVKRFQVEVKAAARLDHPNIVRAHDAEQAGDLHFLVMEYVEGSSLARIVRERGPLPAQQACRCIRHAARGLQHAFEKGMVHRDIKPQNLMLTSQRLVKILDFGLARLARNAETEGPLPSVGGVPDSTIVTAAGDVFGTPDYIAPEQAHDSRDVDIRADIYSLGCTLYFLLTGGPPFPEKSSADKLAAHTDRPLPPLEIDGSPAPAKLTALLNRMTAKDPAGRFATPAEVVAAIDDVLAMPEEPAAPRPTRWWDVSGRRPVTLALMAAAAGLLSLAAWHSTADSSRASRQKESAPAADVPGPSPSQQRPSEARPSPGGPTRPADDAPAAGVVAARAAANEGSRVLFVMPEQFASVDYAGLRRAIEDRSGSVTVASTGPCTPMQPGPEGRLVTPDLIVPSDPLDISRFDSVVLIGGSIHRFKDPGPARDAVWRAIDDALAAGKPVAAIDLAQGILAIKGDLRTRKVSPSAVVRQRMPDYAAGFDEAPVVSDRGILTAGSAAAAAELAERLLSGTADSRQ